ncbi:Alpha/Beta hydrolase protein [Linnemannia elongata]|nr:Alpha/Beta hydrolase protein [Linnemannia elongata]
MDMETVSQILMGHQQPSWDFFNATIAAGPLRFLAALDQNDGSLVLPLLVLLPFLLVSLFRHYTNSAVVLTYNDDPASIRLFNQRTGKEQTENLIDYILKKCPSLSDPAKGATFKPTMWMTSGHLQTAYAAYRDFNSVYKIPYERELLTTPDGGTVSVDWAPSVKTMPADDTPTLVLLHGLTGGSHESYIRALVETMTKDHGYRCVVFNARACANTELTSAQLYCGSWTDDLRMVVKHIRKTLPESKLMSVGFSLGANILMNYMGEEGDQCEFLGAMSVGNPFDLMGTCLAIERGWLGSKIYSPAMGGNLRRIFMKHTKWFENSDIVDVDLVLRGRSIRDFDDAVTRRVFKYRTVHEYYRMASSSQRILDIKRPFLCLNALDDPIAVSECLPRDEVKNNPFGLLATTARGGHLGWFEGFFSQKRWCTKPLAEFCIALFEADRRPVSRTPSNKPKAAADVSTIENKEKQQDDNSGNPESHIVRNIKTLEHMDQGGATTMPLRNKMAAEKHTQKASHSQQHVDRQVVERRDKKNSLAIRPFSRKSFWATLLPLIVYYIMKRR